MAGYALVDALVDARIDIFAMGRLKYLLEAYEAARSSTLDCSGVRSLRKSKALYIALGVLSEEQRDEWQMAPRSHPCCGSMAFHGYRPVSL